MSTPAGSVTDGRESGGFINITQSTKRLVFMGTYTAGGLEVTAGDGRLQILKEGKLKKIVPKVMQMSFNGPYSASRGIDILYVTERAVFTIRNGRLTLIEIAPGVDLRRDVLDQATAEITVAPDLKTMDPRIFFRQADAAMNCTCGMTFRVTEPKRRICQSLGACHSLSSLIE